MRYRYDGADRQTAALYPGGITIERQYDGASRLAALPGYVSRVDYTERGQLGGATFTNGVKTAWEYDSRQRLSRLSTTASDLSAIVELTFSRTRLGLLTGISDTASRPARAAHGATFSYDGWNRVTEAKLARQDGAPEVLSFSYDLRDAILSQTSSLAGSRAHVGDYAYDATKVNAVSAAGATAYGYDEAGQLSTRGATAYAYDHLGRMVSASGEVTGTFRFGAGPLRVQKDEGDFTTRFESEDFEVRDGIAVVYARLGGKRVARIESDALAATLLSDLVPNQTIDIADAWLAQAAAAGVAQPAMTPSAVKALLASAARRLLMQDVVWLHGDHLGSVVAATGADGTVLAEQSFYPAGELRSSTGYVDDYGFTGQQRDASSGLIHFQFRELDPLSGRWASVDPLFHQLTPGSVPTPGESTTGYAYVANNFANVVDPTGLSGKGSFSDGSRQGAPAKAVPKKVVIKRPKGPSSGAGDEHQARIAAGIAQASPLQRANIAELQQANPGGFPVTEEQMSTLVSGGRFTERAQANLAEVVRITEAMRGIFPPETAPYNVIIPGPAAATGPYNVILGAAPAQESNYALTPAPAPRPAASGDYALSPNGSK